MRTENSYSILLFLFNVFWLFFCFTCISFFFLTYFMLQQCFRPHIAEMKTIKKPEILDNYLMRPTYRNADGSRVFHCFYKLVSLFRVKLSSRHRSYSTCFAVYKVSPLNNVTVLQNHNHSADKTLYEVCRILLVTILLEIFICFSGRFRESTATNYIEKST